MRMPLFLESRESGKELAWDSGMGMDGIRTQCDYDSPT